MTVQKGSYRRPSADVLATIARKFAVLSCGGHQMAAGEG
jgi:hypothetical protein